MKQKILSKIRSSLAGNLIEVVREGINPSNVFADKKKQRLDILFADQYTQTGGQLIYCENTAETLAKLTLLLKTLGQNVSLFCSHESLVDSVQGLGKIVNKPNEADVALTGCDFLIARTGSIVFSDKHESRANSIAAPTHIILAKEQQIVYDMEEAIASYSELPPMVSFVTGPSRTADIEKTLVVGVHGPQVLYLLLTKS